MQGSNVMGCSSGHGSGKQIRLVTSHVLIALSFLFLLGACSSGKQSQGRGGDGQGQTTPSGSALTEQDQQLASLNLQVARSYAVGALQINYRADSNLNLYEFEPHTLLLLVYQLNGVNGFNDAAKDAEGLRQLMKGERFDPSVMAVNRYFVEPGETKRLDIDRAENVKWVGVVAGYYNLVPGQATRVFEVPVTIETKGVYGFRKKEAKLDQLIVNLFLGAESIQEVPSQ